MMGRYLDQIQAYEKNDGNDQIIQAVSPDPQLNRFDRLFRTSGKAIKPSESEYELADRLGAEGALDQFKGCIDLINWLNEGDDQWIDWTVGDAIKAACRWWGLLPTEMQPIHWLSTIQYMTRKRGAIEVRSFGDQS